MCWLMRSAISTTRSSCISHSKSIHKDLGKGSGPPDFRRQELDGVASLTAGLAGRSGKRPSRKDPVLPEGWGFQNLHQQERAVIVIESPAGIIRQIFAD